MSHYQKVFLTLRLKSNSVVLYFDPCMVFFFYVQILIHPKFVPMYGMQYLYTYICYFILLLLDEGCYFSFLVTMSSCFCL